jgi:hypothetical protein
VIVTEVPTDPLVGLNFPIHGTTAKVLLLVAVPPSVVMVIFSPALASGGHHLRRSRAAVVTGTDGEGVQHSVSLGVECRGTCRKHDNENREYLDLPDISALHEPLFDWNVWRCSPLGRRLGMAHGRAGFLDRNGQQR